MRISVTNGTIRTEDKTGSTAWPLYMAAPGSVRNPLFKNVAKELKLANAGDPSVDIELLSGSIRVDGVHITPDSIPVHAKAVCDLIYAHDTGIFSEICALRQLKDIPREPITEKRRAPIATRKVVDGKLIITTTEEEQDFQLYDAMDVFDGDGNQIYDDPVQARDSEGKKLFEAPKPEDIDPETSEPKPEFKPIPIMAASQPRIHREPRFTKGKMVSQVNKDRLAELETTVQNM